ncbi:MAG: carboxypeptidase-like regulatory domain-containing protein, partial [Acidobacteriota bacterium]|nr:carboxypeptidase-like regulatory domain-containing protein [Acidobacteriota bacterium]
MRLLRRANSSRRELVTSDQGRFSFTDIDAGEYRLTAESTGFPILTKNILIRANDGTEVADIQFSALASQNQSVTVSGSVSDIGLFAPDPAQRFMVRDETLDANPGRPGMPISVPGMPAESPAGGV